MVKTYISLDKEKILKEGIYDYDKVSNSLQKVLKASGLNLDDDGWYIGTLEENAVFMQVLFNHQWIINYFKKWHIWNLKINALEDALKSYYSHEKEDM